MSFLSVSISLFYCFFHSLLIFWTVYLLLFLPHRSVSVTCCSFCAPHLEFVYSFVLNQGWLATHFFFVVASPALVVGMQGNEYTDAQVGDAGGLFKSLDPAPCGAVPAYLIQCSSSSLPDPVPPVPVYLIQCCSSSLPHPVLWFHAVCLIHCSGSILPHPVFQFQSTSSSTGDFNFSCSLFLFLYNFFLSNFTSLW